MQIIKSIESRIYVIRGERVMVDFDLASLYEVETKVLNQSVRRNHSRFPEDFMFQLTSFEWSDISIQSGKINSSRWQHKCEPVTICDRFTKT